MQHSGSKVLVALDYDDTTDALALVKQLEPGQCRLKVGKELFCCGGPELVKQLIELGFDVFLDLKFHDIPNTTAKAVKAAAEMGVWMVNVHASGGERMMRAAKAELDKLDLERKPLLIAVTVLTSMEQADLQQIGLNIAPAEQVKRLAVLAKNAGLDGVVCSAREADELQALCGKEFVLVTPGIRPVDSQLDDQRRVATPKAAVEQGSHYLVIGRPITQAADPEAVLARINAELQS